MLTATRVAGANRRLALRPLTLTPGYPDNVDTDYDHGRQKPRSAGKSFLVLFFKKEPLAAEDRRNLVFIPIGFILRYRASPKMAFRAQKTAEVAA